MNDQVANYPIYSKAMMRQAIREDRSYKQIMNLRPANQNKEIYIDMYFMCLNELWAEVEVPKTTLGKMIYG